MSMEHNLICFVFQLRTALKEQQDVNSQLRGYIDGILMNIIDKYPELLEVRKWTDVWYQIWIDTPLLEVLTHTITKKTMKGETKFWAEFI
jgi:hypothetical protein